jgi:hypothetical protein
LFRSGDEKSKAKVGSVAEGQWALDGLGEDDLEGNGYCAGGAAPLTMVSTGLKLDGAEDAGGNRDGAEGSDLRGAWEAGLQKETAQVVFR